MDLARTSENNAGKTPMINAPGTSARYATNGGSPKVNHRVSEPITAAVEEDRTEEPAGKERCPRIPSGYNY